MTRVLVGKNVLALDQICDVIFPGATLAEDDGKGSVAQATVANLAPTFFKGVFRRVRRPSNDSRAFRNHDLALAAAAHDPGFIGRQVSYVHVAEGETVIPSTEVLVIRPDRKRVSAAWLWTMLRSPFGYRQIQACVRGISAHIYSDDIGEILIPMPADAASEALRPFDELLKEAAEMKRVAAKLLSGARLLVEALIERKLTETELAVALSDPESDRALLSRLTDKGLDGGGTPLFADVDVLQSLVAEAITQGDP
ncbi:MAG: hypothetical protein U1F43_37205 [Myxococcota bacterium]